MGATKYDGIWYLYSGVKNGVEPGGFEGIYEGVCGTPPYRPPHLMGAPSWPVASTVGLPEGAATAGAGQPWPGMMGA